MAYSNVISEVMSENAGMCMGVIKEGESVTERKSNNQQWIMYELGIQEKWIWVLALALIPSTNLV